MLLIMCFLILTKLILGLSDSRIIKFILFKSPKSLKKNVTMCSNNNALCE